MKKILICLLAAMSLSCHPDVIDGYIDDVVWAPVPDDTEDDNDIDGGLEDPVENPEQEW